MSDQSHLKPGIFTGKLIVFTAPSGAGKTTIVRHIIRRFNDQLAFSVSATTRARRGLEVDGRDYYFLSLENFERRIEAGEFLEWEEVYTGSRYGTLRAEVERLWSQHRHVIFDVDVKGALSLKAAYPERCLVVFIRPPSFEILEARLRSRATEDEKSLQRRLARVRYELGFETHCDRTLINDELDHALQEAESLVAVWLSAD